ncbi:MAG: PilT protein domain protein [Nevskia sp.]|nr:PilT protein domain protein [Nevskia sp.]
MISLLLDSQALLWAMDGSKHLGKTARALLKAQNDPVGISVASVWELAIKHARGGIDLPDDFVDKIAEAGFQILPTSPGLFWRAGHLPRHHGDPFDRLIIAQALDMALAVMTSDAIFPSYGIKVVDASR